MNGPGRADSVTPPHRDSHRQPTATATQSRYCLTQSAHDTIAIGIAI